MKITKTWIKPSIRKKKGKIELIKGHYTIQFIPEEEKQCKAMTMTGKRCKHVSCVSGYCIRHYRKIKKEGQK